MISRVLVYFVEPVGHNSCDVVWVCEGHQMVVILHLAFVGLTRCVTVSFPILAVHCWCLVVEVFRKFEGYRGV